MSTGEYEVHNLENTALPILFHHDERRKYINRISNWHSNIEILYCTGGSGWILYDSVEYVMKAGDIIVINSNALHAIRSEILMQYDCLLVDSNFLAENEIVVEEITFEPMVRSDTAASLYQKIVEEYEADDSYRIATIKALVLALIAFLARHYSSKDTSLNHRRFETDDNIKLAISYIKTNFYHKMTLDDIADKVGLSKYYLAHEFKRATGMTVVTFINTLRCQNARKLLLQKKYTIHETALICGFENDSYFSKTFKTIMGCLPSEI